MAAEAPLYFARGKLTDRCLSEGNIGVVVGTSSIGCRNFGITGQVYSIYPYGDIVSARRRQHFYQRAVPEDRSPVGSCGFRKPPSYPHSEDPSVITLVSQYNYGPATDDDKDGIVEGIARMSKDVEFVEGLKADTTLQRIENFKKCINELRLKAIQKENEKINLYAFPAGIGRNMVDTVWMESYLPVLKQLAASLKWHNINIAVFVDEKYFAADELKLLTSLESIAS